jgi:uncharacterized protein (TIGR02147 family)
MPSPRDVDVFDYLDYRAFLRDVYLHRKGKRGMSYRAFSRRAGLKSPNYLKRVIDAERNLTSDMAARFAKALSLDDDSTAYFLDLVRFNQARTSTERNTYYGKLTGFRRYRKAQPLELAQAAYHSTWYLPAIRELVARGDFEEDPDWIAQQMLPPITRKEAARALETLMALGLVVRAESGRLAWGEPVVSTGAETRGLHIVNYHRTMLERAGQSLDLVAPADRDISSLTLCLGDDGVRRIKERIQRFRRELLELAMLEDDPSQVVQVNFQVFPLTRPRDAR